MQLVSSVYHHCDSANGPHFKRFIVPLVCMAFPHAMRETPIQDEGVIPPSPVAGYLDTLHPISHSFIEPSGDFGFVVFTKVAVHVALPQAHHLRCMAVKNHFTSGVLQTNPNAFPLHLSRQKLAKGNDKTCEAHSDTYRIIEHNVHRYDKGRIAAGQVR